MLLVMFKRMHAVLCNNLLKLGNSFLTLFQAKQKLFTCFISLSLICTVEKVSNFTIEM